MHGAGTHPSSTRRNAAEPRRWPDLEGHKAGASSYCHLEKLHNLEALPPNGFFISCSRTRSAMHLGQLDAPLAIFDDALMAHAETPRAQPLSPVHAAGTTHEQDHHQLRHLHWFRARPRCRPTCPARRRDRRASIACAASERRHHPPARAQPRQRQPLRQPGVYMQFLRRISPN